MPRSSKFDKAVDNIKRYFDNLPQRIFTRSEVLQILEEKRDEWNLAKSMRDNDFLDAIVELANFAPVNLEFRNLTVDNYFYDRASMIALASKITKKTYLSHYTSLSLHNLTEQIPKVIYVTKEQSKKNANKNEITQENINKAFQREQRTSDNHASLADYKVILLEGKFSNNLGVITDKIPDTGEEIKLTNIERTLIDITVRPNYAGGVYEVLKAYQLAHDRVSINKMLAMLSKLDYIYPYHQAIGFYLEKAGAYKPSVIELVRRLEIKYDFYLSYNMAECEYSDKWRLFYPKNL